MLEEQNIHNRPDDHAEKNFPELQGVNTEFGFRALFCKDIFFEDEKEFQIVFPDELIDEGKSYDITFTENINVIELNNLLR